MTRNQFDSQSATHYGAVDVMIPRRIAALWTPIVISVLLAIAGCTAPPSPAPVDPTVVVTLPAVVPDPEPGALDSLPEREVFFLEQFQRNVEDGNWQWIIDRAEPNHYQELVGDLKMDEESYLSFLLRIGESYQSRERRDDAEPGYFSPYDAVSVVFTAADAGALSTVVEGLMYNRHGRSIDFTVTLLSQLQELRVTGAYY